MREKPLPPEKRWRHVQLEPPPDMLQPIESRRAHLLNHLSPEDRAYHTELEVALAPLERQLLALPDVKRLRTRTQLGGKARPVELPRKGEAAVWTPAFHTRFHHTQLQGELAKAAAARLRLEPNQAKVLLTSSWLHDIGHSAFSHTGDDILMEKGEPNHEGRALQRIEGALAPTLRAVGVDVDAVVETIDEKHALGTVQSVLDTLSYLIVDAESCGFEISKDDGAGIINAMSGFDKKRELVVLRNPSEWQSLLEARAAMMQAYYYHPVSRRAQEAGRQMLRVAMRDEFITVDDLKFEDEDVLDQRLASLTRYDHLAAIMGARSGDTPYLKDYRELYAMSHGIESDDYERIECATQGEANSLLHAQPLFAIDKSFVVPPFDYTKKTLHVLVEKDGRMEEVALRTKETELQHEDVIYSLYLYKGAHST